MNTLIQDNDPLAEVQNIVRNCYPNLRVDFFERDLHGLVKSRSGKPVLDYANLLGSFRIDKIDDGQFNVAGDISVKAFEDYIDSNYCLHAQLSRRDGEEWMVIEPGSRGTLREYDRGNPQPQSCDVAV